jgi:phosphotransferase system IIB component
LTEENTLFMQENKSEINKESIIKLESAQYASFERLLTKVGLLISKNNEINEENLSLKENIKELNNKITELKLELNKLSSDSVFKDQEISSLKNLLLNSEVGNNSIQNKENVKSRIKELISRIDVHLDQYEQEQPIADE